MLLVCLYLSILKYTYFNDFSYYISSFSFITLVSAVQLLIILYSAVTFLEKTNIKKMFHYICYKKCILNHCTLRLQRIYGYGILLTVKFMWMYTLLVWFVLVYKQPGHLGASPCSLLTLTQAYCICLVVPSLYKS